VALSVYLNKLAINLAHPNKSYFNYRFAKGLSAHLHNLQHKLNRRTMNYTHIHAQTCMRNKYTCIYIHKWNNSSGSYKLFTQPANPTLALLFQRQTTACFIIGSSHALLLFLCMVMRAGNSLYKTTTYMVLYLMLLYIVANEIKQQEYSTKDFTP
jgi:hypothetical protein